MNLFRTLVVNPIFIVVSDDMVWCREHIVGPDVIYAPDEAVEDTKIGRDLALLASCSHTILTYGTFGLWAALLSGGLTLKATNFALKDPEPYLTDWKQLNDTWLLIDQTKESTEYLKIMEEKLRTINK